MAARRYRAEARRTHLSLGESRTARTLTFTVLTVLALLWLLPMAWGLLTAFKSEQDASDPVHWLWPKHGFTLSGFRSVWDRGELPLWMFNSFLVAAVVTVITVAVSAMAGYAFSRPGSPAADGCSRSRWRPSSYHRRC